MKNSFLLFCSLLAAQVSFAQKTNSTKAELKDVTVFTNAAEMNHTASVQLPTGTSEIVFTHVANSIDENSIQVGTNGSVTVLSVRPALNYLETDVKTAQYIEVEGNYKKATSTLKSLQNQKITEESLLKLLEQNQKIGGDNSSTSVAELMKMTEYYKPKYLEVKNNITALEEKIEAQQAIVNKALIQFNEVKGQTSGTGGQLIMQVMTNQAGTQPFQISYMANNAGWNASYDLRANDTKSPLQIVYKANVLQQTGVDWNQVKLRLSTSNPTQGGIAPTLTPWLLYFNNPNNIRIRGVASPQANMLMDEVVVTGAVAKEAKLSSKALGNYVQQTENQLSTTFDVDIPYTIASNGKQHSVSLKEYAQPANYEYFVAPRVQQDVFLVAELTDYEKLNLIPGQANVMFENMLVGKTYINPYTNNDTLKLSMGRDKMIAVKRERMNDLSQSKILGSSKRQSIVYEISIKNNKKSGVDLTVQDQFPISTDKTIEVTVDETSGASIDKETGIVTWNVNIAPGSTKKLKFGYTVKYPKDKQVTIY